jgi:hypothetical protein
VGREVEGPAVRRGRAVVAAVGVLAVILVAGNALAVHPQPSERLLVIGTDATPNEPTGPPPTTSPRPTDPLLPTTPSQTSSRTSKGSRTPPSSHDHTVATTGIRSTHETSSRPAPTSVGSATAAPRSSGPTTPGSTAGSSGPTSAPAAGRVVTGYVTAYTWYDNDPPGPAIADPVLHSSAGGSGTYADPVTVAVAAGAYAPGTRLYLPHVKRYFMVEDTCASCGAKPVWVDMWIDGRSGGEAAVQECASRLTGDFAIEIDPPAGRPVASAPLFGSGGCYSG